MRESSRTRTALRARERPERTSQPETTRRCRNNRRTLPPTTPPAPTRSRAGRTCATPRGQPAPRGPQPRLSRNRRRGKPHAEHRGYPSRNRSRPASHPLSGPIWHRASRLTDQSLTCSIIPTRTDISLAIFNRPANPSVRQIPDIRAPRLASQCRHRSACMSAPRGCCGGIVAEHPARGARQISTVRAVGRAGCRPSAQGMTEQSCRYIAMDGRSSAAATLASPALVSRSTQLSGGSPECHRPMECWLASEVNARRTRDAQHQLRRRGARLG
jgi:hypothetical protein